MIFHQYDNYGREAAAYLPYIDVIGVDEPVIQIVQEPTEEVLYTIRAPGRQSFRPWVFAPGVYTLIVGEPGTDRMRVIEDIRAPARSGPRILVDLH